MKTKRLIILVAVLTLVLAACGGGSSSDTPVATVAAGEPDPVAGADIYKGTCAACHGTDLAGIDGLGKQLSPSSFVMDNSVDELYDFILVGRPAGDPENTTGVDMSPRGGNPSLSDQDIKNVIAYIRAQN